MGHIVVITEDVHLEEWLKAARFRTRRLPLAEAGSLARDPNAPDAIVVDTRGQSQIPAVVSAVRRQHPAIGIVLVASALDPQLMLEAMRAGVNECVAEPVTAQSIEEAVRRVIVHASSASTGQVFAFVGAKGGVGTTTLAVNTAVSLGKIATGTVLFADLHLAHGDAALFLGATPRFSVVDALESVHRLDAAVLGSLVQSTRAGIDLLGSSDQLVHAPVEPARTRTLLEFLQQQYQYVVLDVPRADPTMLDSLESATSVVVVANQEVAAVRSAGRLATALRQRYGADRVKVVMSRFDGRSEIAAADVERALGVAVGCVLPSDYRAAVAALNTGSPIVLDGQSKLGNAFRSFARDLAGVVREKTERPGSVLGRLAWRRA